MDVLTIGGKFGDYDVLALVGRGSMGAVYRIRDPKTGNEYACKVMFPEAAERNPDYRKRFAREAAFAMSIKHPNLIAVYDVGEDPETGLCYLIMDYVSGGTVEDKLARGGRFPIDEAVSVIEHIAGALAVADKMHVVHRDIKPANIMFAADGTPKLADLGIARFNDGSATTTVTSAGMIVGTPAYMAPEQMTDSHSVDIRADIYSLGMVFFEMLSGERPNAGCSVVELLAKAIKGEGIPDVRTMRPEVSSSVAHILNLMCAPKPENRISTPQQVVDMFWRLEHGQALIAKMPPQPSKKMLARRRKRMLTRVAVGAGGVVIFIVAYLLGAMGRGTGAGADRADGTNSAPAVARAPAHSSLREGLQFPDPATLLAGTNDEVVASSQTATNEVAAAAAGQLPVSATNASAVAAASAPSVPSAAQPTNAAVASAKPAKTAESAPRNQAAPAEPEVPREFPSVEVSAWTRRGGRPFDWLSIEPPKSEVPLRIAWDFSHGFQLSCCQYTGFIFDNVFLGGGMPDGETYVSRPVLFSLAHADLENADVLVLPTCYAGMAYTKDDLVAVRSFVENGGTVLVFANEQNMLEQSVLLKDYGIKLDVAKDNSRSLKGICPVLSKWRIENSYSYGEDTFVSATSDTEDAFPMVATDDSDRLSLMMMRRSGLGKVIFVSDRLFGRGQAGYVNTRWWRTLVTRCVRAGQRGGELRGETLADAPVVSKAGHFVFYGAKSVSKMVASATRLAKLAVPAFDKYDLGLSPIKGGFSAIKAGASPADGGASPADGGASSTDGGASPGAGRPERVYVMAATGSSPGIHQSGSFEFLVSDSSLDPQYMLVPLLFPAGSAEYRNSPLGYNAYLLTLVLEDCGYRRQAQEARSALAADYKLGRTVAPFEVLRTRYRGIFQRAAALARRDDVKALIIEKPTEDDLVAILSMAAGRNLFPLFWKNGIEVSRVKSDIALKFVADTTE